MRLVAGEPAGLFRGVQTLRQLLPAAIESAQSAAGVPKAWTVPAGRIVDRPRFAYRGAMLDVARHFFTVKETQQFIDLLALYKLNTLHLHLSDDQGWRIQIDSWPRLATFGGSTQVGGGPGGHSTKADYWPDIENVVRRLLPNAPVFPSVNRWTASDKHREACGALGIEDYQLKDSRHTYAVRAIRAGAPFEHVAAQLGHTDTIMVVRVYARFRPTENERTEWEKIAALQDEAARKAQ